MRKELGQALVDYGKGNEDVVVLDADVANSTMTVLFQQAFPERFFNVGIAEAGMIDTAVGLSLGGKLPFVSAFAAMLCNRGMEQIRTCVSYNNANVKLIAGFAGVSDYKDGATHHSIFDLAVMRAMPNMTVVIPADAFELKELIPKVAEFSGPVYLRVSRAEVPQVFRHENDDMEIGKGRIIAEGSDLTLAVTGVLLSRTLQAQEKLLKKGISARVAEFHTLKPFDIDLACRCASETKLIITIEEHSIVGGLYGAMCETLGCRIPTRILPIGIRDRYQCTAPDAESLLDYCGLSADAIVSVVEAALEEKV
jgi:transketolase